MKWKLRLRKLEYAEFKSDINKLFTGERILCAAVDYKGQIIPGYRHDDCIRIISNIYLQPKVSQAMQGFLTSKNRFVSRKEASKIAYDAGQIDKLTDLLLSEDLY